MFGREERTTSREVAVLSVQVAEVIRDVNEVRRQLDDHQRGHEAEARDRRTTRRWVIGAAIAFLAAIDGPLLYVVGHIH